MIFNTDLALYLLRQGKDYIKRHGWANHEPFLERSHRERSRYSRQYDAPRDHFNAYERDKNGPASGVGAILIAAIEYDIRNGSQTVSAAGNRVGLRQLWNIPLDTSTYMSMSLANTYYAGAVYKLLDEKDIQYNDHHANLGKNEILQAFDVADACLKAQVRTFAQTITVAPKAIERFNEEMEIAKIKSDKVLQADAIAWLEKQRKELPQTRKITVKEHEHERK